MALARCSNTAGGRPVGYNQAMANFAVVAAVNENSADEVAFRLGTAPPFDLPLDGIDGHQAYLGREHAAFVFWGSDPEGALVRASGRPDALERFTHAITGMRTPRKLDETFEWMHRAGGRQRPDRAVAVIARGVTAGPDPDQERGQGLVDALGGHVQRIRMFSSEGTGLIVVERTRAEVATETFLLPEDLVAAEPVAPLRRLEVLKQTYWYEAGTLLSSRPADGILPPAHSATS
jgi:hypothetical protein